MDMWQLLGLQKKLTVEQAAQLWTRARHDKVTRAAEGVITDAIESRELAADIVRWGVYYADLGTELPEGNINQHETTVKRRDFDAWLKSIGQTIALPPEVVVPEVSQQAPTAPELHIVGVGNTAEMTPAERRAQLDMTLERGCRLRILTRWNDIEKLHGPRPSRRQVLWILNKEQDEEKLEITNVGNTLAILRKAGLIEKK